MDERKKQVLYAIITDYIATAEPVGSRSLAKKYGLGVSPATIRNEMSDLEERGYIKQPHASAGRKPSNKGYRYYVDYLMEKDTLAPQEASIIRASLNEGLSEMDLMMRRCCQMISRLTNYTAMIALPSENRKVVEGLRLLMIDERKVLLIIVTSGGNVRHRLIEVQEPVSLAQLSLLEATLQERLLGQDVDSIGLTIFREMINAFGKQQAILNYSLELMQEVLAPNFEEKFFSSGAYNMLSQPEFQDHDKLKSLISVLEEEDQLKSLLKPPDNDKSQVTIGEELGDSNMRDCSLITATYQVGDGRKGVIGVIGPTRMSYQKTLPLLEFIASLLSDLKVK